MYSVKNNLNITIIFINNLKKYIRKKFTYTDSYIYIYIYMVMLYTRYVLTAI